MDDTRTGISHRYSMWDDLVGVIHFGIPSTARCLPWKVIDTEGFGYALRRRAVG